ncbi:hypothetical protein K431DRAFT_151884 [Polychaeton citri CBS 116435]|uniref:Uncharacterized protein n=1 Tax=Polychaeton citri CBS 116435 TaxID=1314669 RepID=A0A9P4Q3Z7_9PEZI|nr:hypothetical protein K431DRAFT_151884 [Polychaeton citri CBS 116435]
MRHNVCTESRRPRGLVRATYIQSCGPGNCWTHMRTGVFGTVSGRHTRVSPHAEQRDLHSTCAVLPRFPLSSPACLPAYLHFPCLCVPGSLADPGWPAAAASRHAVAVSRFRLVVTALNGGGAAVCIDVP